MIVGSRRKQRGALRTHDSAGEAPPARACAAQPPPPSQNSAPQGAQSGELDQRHTMSFHQCRQSATNCRHISVAPVAQSLTIQSYRGCPISASLLSTGDRGGRPGGHHHQSRPQERRLNARFRLCRAMLAPAAAPPGRPRVFPQAEKTNPGGSGEVTFSGRTGTR